MARASGDDIVFLTLSTGIGGGVVSGGRLVVGRHGLGASVGQTSLAVDAGYPHRGRRRRRRDGAGGPRRRPRHRRPRRLRRQRSPARPGPTRSSRTAATIIARLIVDLQKLFDPAFVVIGGSIGLAAGFLDRLRAALADVPEPFHPEIRAAGLGKHAGVIGVADLARQAFIAKGD